MSYSNSPLLPKARRQAVNLVLKEGFSITVAARRSGIHRTTLQRWLKRAKGLHGGSGVPTLSSKPKSCPWRLSEEIVFRVIELRRQHRRCGKVIHALLLREGTVISVSSVNNILSRAGYLNSWYGRPGRVRRPRVPRPAIKTPGDLAEVDTIHLRTKINGRVERLYVYTLIDVHSRWVHAAVSATADVESSIRFIRQARRLFPRRFKVIQTDNGSEFSAAFERFLNENGISQRRIRLGKKNDNSHVERFNRTIQDECIGVYPDFGRIRRDTALWLDFYNNERLHLGLQCKTPLEVLQRS